MRRLGLIIVVCLIPIFLGNKSCEKVAKFEHPAVDKGVECKDCHDDGRTKETKPKGHDLAWERNHGSWIRQYGFKPETTCMLCHNESTCTSCHQQEKPRDHTNFWTIKGHGLSVGLNRSRCMSCHRGADFCERCHSQTQPTDHTAAWGLPNNRHCLSCHEPIGSAGAQKCAVCHGAGTPSHAQAPNRPNNGLHGAGAVCANCHGQRHPDNGTRCTVCHGQ